MYSFRSYLQRADVLFVLKAILDRAYASKRLVVGIIVALLILLYTGPYLLFGRKHNRLASSHVCLDDYLQQTYKHYLINEHIYYSFINFVRDVNVKDRKFIPFVGNGLFGLNVADSFKILYIKHRDTLSVDLPFDPIVNLNANYPYSEDSEAIVLDTFNGIVIRVTAYSVYKEGLQGTTININKHLDGKDDDYKENDRKTICEI
uniref:Uncharacterized protein n=1 Tax=Romanomermis culicivorax TaxID=13658 RepID=A0A915KCL7_ROMCU